MLDKVMIIVIRLVLNELILQNWEDCLWPNHSSLQNRICLAKSVPFSSWLKKILIQNIYEIPEWTGFILKSQVQIKSIYYTSHTIIIIHQQHSHLSNVGTSASNMPIELIINHYFHWLCTNIKLIKLQASKVAVKCWASTYHCYENQ